MASPSLFVGEVHISRKEKSPLKRLRIRVVNLGKGFGG